MYACCSLLGFLCTIVSLVSIKAYKRIYLMCLSSYLGYFIQAKPFKIIHELLSYQTPSDRWRSPKTPMLHFCLPQMMTVLKFEDNFCRFVCIRSESAAFVDSWIGFTFPSIISLNEHAKAMAVLWKSDLLCSASFVVADTQLVNGDLKSLSSLPALRPDPRPKSKQQEQNATRLSATIADQSSCCKVGVKTGLSCTVS